MFQTFTERTSRCTERMKRNREDEEEEVKFDAPVPRDDLVVAPLLSAMSLHTTTTHNDNDTASVGPSHCCSDDENDDEEDEQQEQKPFSYMPIIRSEKQEWREDLCRFLKENNGPASVKAVEARYGWSPAMKLGNGVSRAESSLADYILVTKGLVYALPTEEDWNQLRENMRKSAKLQEEQGFGKSDPNQLKTFKYLSAEDFNDEYNKIYAHEKGLFRVQCALEDGYIRRQHLSSWISNNNGKFFLDERPMAKRLARAARNNKKKAEESTTCPEKSIVDSDVRTLMYPVKEAPLLPIQAVKVPAECPTKKEENGFNRLPLWLTAPLNFQ